MTGRALRAIHRNDICPISGPTEDIPHLFYQILSVIFLQMTGGYLIYTPQFEFNYA